MSKIFVTKTFLPPQEEYQAYIKQIWDTDQLTNQGPLLNQLESELIQYLKIPNFQMVSNGTSALQLALRALDITDGEVITTPFTYVATTSAILWERCQPVFVDIDPNTLCIDPTKIEAAITEKTKAILAVHVFGNPCDVEEIAKIAEKHNLKVIYDAAHAFAVDYKGESILTHGDVSICSFHATKLFHTVEGGGIVVRDSKVGESINLMKRFGHEGDDHIQLGINAKTSEFHAAMGLCNLKYVDELIEKRRAITELYTQLLGDVVTMPSTGPDVRPNYAYYPIIFKTEEKLLQTVAALQDQDIYPRRYFYPSLNELPYIEKGQTCLVSEDISRRILCLPFYADLPDADIHNIAKIVKENA